MIVIRNVFGFSHYTRHWKATKSCIWFFGRVPIYLIGPWFIKVFTFMHHKENHLFSCQGLKIYSFILYYNKIAKGHIIENMNRDLIFHWLFNLEYYTRSFDRIKGWPMGKEKINSLIKPLLLSAPIFVLWLPIHINLSITFIDFAEIQKCICIRRLDFQPVY